MCDDWLNEEIEIVCIADTCVIRFKDQTLRRSSTWATLYHQVIAL